MKTKSLALWLAAVGPVAVLFAGIGYGAWQEYRAWPIARQEIIDISKQRILANQAQLARFTNPTLGDKATRVTYEELDAMYDSLKDQADRLDLSLRYDAYPQAMSHDPKSWPEAPLAKILMDAAEPMVVKLETWLGTGNDQQIFLPQTPTYWDGLLANNFRYAFYSDDNEHAIRYLSLMGKLMLNDSTDLDIDGQISCLSRRVAFYQLVGSSLERQSWTATQLEELFDLISQPLQIAERLEAVRQQSDEVFVNRTFLAYDWSLGNEEELRWTPSVDSITINSGIEISRQSNGIMGVDDLSKSVAVLRQPKKIIRSGVFSTAFDSPSGYVSDYASVQLPTIALELAVVEDFRRLLLVALALRKYHLANDTLPNALDELKSKNENQELNLKMVDGQSFLYSLVAGLGNQASLSGLRTFYNDQFGLAFYNDQFGLALYGATDWLYAPSLSLRGITIRD